MRGDDGLFCLPPLPALLNAILSPLLERSLLQRFLLQPDILLLVVCLLVDPNVLDLDLLYLQLEISILAALGPHVLIDAGALADFFGEEVFAPVQVAVLLLIVRCTVQVRLEF